MENYYTLLGITQTASPAEIKKAFREKAKRLHPDIAGSSAEPEMQRLLAAYEVLSNRERRWEYDRAYSRFSRSSSFDYRKFLREAADDPVCQARLIFFDLLHLEEDEALAIWTGWGGVDFPLEKYLDREDWMDCAFLLAEELEKRSRYYEAFSLFAALVKEERRQPYFRHFIEEVENSLKELARLRLKAAVDGETYAACMETLLGLGFPAKDEARWLRSLAETLVSLGELPGARSVFREALRRDPGLSRTARLKTALGV